MSRPFIQAGFALLLLRVGTGVIFILHGYPKMTGRGNQEKHERAHLTQSLAQLGLPFPYAFAVLVGAIEFFGCVLLSLGVQTQWATLALLGGGLVSVDRFFLAVKY